MTPFHEPQRVLQGEKLKQLCTHCFAALLEVFLCLRWSANLQKINIREWMWPPQNKQPTLAINPQTFNNSFAASFDGSEFWGRSAKASSTSFTSSSISSSVSSSSTSGSTSPTRELSTWLFDAGFFLLGGVRFDRNFLSAIAIACEKQLFVISYQSSIQTKKMYCDRCCFALKLIPLSLSFFPKMHILLSLTETLSEVKFCVWIKWFFQKCICYHRLLWLPYRKYHTSAKIHRTLVQCFLHCDYLQARKKTAVSTRVPIHLTANGR